MTIKLSNKYKINMMSVEICMPPRAKKERFPNLNNSPHFDGGSVQ